MGVDNQFHYQHANCLCAVKAKAKLKMTENCGIYNNHLPFQHNPHAIGIFCNAIMDKNYIKMHTSKSPPGINHTLREMRSAKNVLKMQQSVVGGDLVKRYMMWVLKLRDLHLSH